MKKLMAAIAFVVVMLPGVALAQTTYPPSETTPPPPTRTTVVCSDPDCDTAVTGTDSIGWGAGVALVLLAGGITATIVARRKFSDG